jgi:uncharacterized protein YkwD
MSRLAAGSAPGPFGPAPNFRQFLSIAILLGSLLAPLALVTPAAAADETIQAFNAINTYRSWLGLPPMKRDPALDASASSHARYYQLNYGDPSLAGMGLHTEQSGKPGFTGADMQARAAAQGYKGSINENIGLSGSMMSSVDWFIATINHRLTLIDPRYTDIGFGVVNDGKAKIEVIDVGAKTWSDTAKPDWVAWPPDGAGGVGLSFWGETPDPFPGASYPVGYPITLKYHGSGAVSFDRVSLAANGQTVPSTFSTGTGWLTKRTCMIAASKPLQPGTTYTVTVAGSANGAAFTRAWSFRTAADSGEELSLSGQFAARALPPGVAAADPAVQDEWWDADGPVSAGWVEQTWLWGPDVFATKTEAYAESPSGQRTVYYFDKSRMEVSDLSADRSSSWFVTNGLLVREMILGGIQIGQSAFAPARPALMPLAGDDAGANPDAPNYASLSGLATVMDDHKLPDLTGTPVQSTLAKDGTVADDPALGDATTLAHYDTTTGHNVAGVFWNWMTSQPWDWLYVLGHPISDPYWVHTKVAGVEQWVLVQAFERRLVTYTPGNDADWQIEMGNVGRHYYQWRYGVTPP